MPVNKAKHVALLRGINVGGKNKLPMKSLAALFTDAGCLNVETYIQSGNVVFGHTPPSQRVCPVRSPPRSQNSSDTECQW